MKIPESDMPRAWPETALESIVTVYPHDDDSHPVENVPKK